MVSASYRGSTTRSRQTVIRAHAWTGTPPRSRSSRDRSQSMRRSASQMNGCAYRCTASRRRRSSTASTSRAASRPWVAMSGVQQTNSTHFGGLRGTPTGAGDARRGEPKRLNLAPFGLAERRRSRTYQPWGYHGLPALKRRRDWMLLWCQGRVDQSSVEAAGDVAFERTHGFCVGLALADSALQVGARLGVVDRP
jgi:hypothetical protein